MSEHLLRIALTELGLVRLACACGATMEMVVGKLNDPTKGIVCPGCGTTLRTVRTLENPDALDHLAKAFAKMKDLQGIASVAFVMKVEEKTKEPLP